MRQHMAHYFRYRYQARNDPLNNTCGTSYITRGFYIKATEERKYLRNSQQHFIAILAAVSTALEDHMNSKSSFNDFLPQPFQTGSALLRISPGAYAVAVVANRDQVLADHTDNGQRDRLADKVHEKLAKWRKWLVDTLSPNLIDADAPERDILQVVATLNDIVLDQEIVHFFDDWVHDSIAGLEKDKFHEFMFNGIGICKVPSHLFWE